MMTVEEIRAALEKHGASVKHKSKSRLMRAIGWFLAFTRINKNFMTRYTTTLGRTMYFTGDVPQPLTDDFIKAHASTIEHELVHVRQWEKWHLLFAISYVLFPLPIGLAWFRWRWERVGYLINIRNGRSIEHCVNALWLYGRPWPRKWMRKWFEEAAARDPSDDPSY